jgi:hypothetical protein
MNLLIDNTGVQAAGLVLEKKARNSQDIRELLQLATLIAFAERLVLDLYESTELASASAFVLSELSALGVDKDTIITHSLDEKTFLATCSVAAESCLIDFPYAFNPIGQDVTPLYPVVLNKGVTQPWVLQLRKVLRAQADSGVEECKKMALESKKVGAVALMLALSDQLRRAVKTYLVGRRLSRGLATEVDTFCRSYFNDAIANQCVAKYAPAAARASLIRQENMFLIKRTGKLIDQTVSQLGGISLDMPSISAYLLQRSKGDPRGVIEEAVRLRERSKPLRRWLYKRTRNVDWGDPIVLFETDQKLKKLRSSLEQELGLSRAPTVADAIEIVFLVGLPTAKLSSTKMVEWIKYRWNRRRARVLTEISKSVVFAANTGHSFQRLVKNTSHQPRIMGELRAKEFVGWQPDED